MAKLISDFLVEKLGERKTEFLTRGVNILLFIAYFTLLLADLFTNPV